MEEPAGGRSRRAAAFGVGGLPGSAVGPAARRACCWWPSRNWRRCCSTALPGSCPTVAFRQEISFSTYEPSPERLNVLLAATTFVRPETSDLPREMYRGRGFVHNTFLGKTSEVSAQPAKPCDYVERVFEILLSRGLGGLDEFQAGLERVNVKEVGDLDPLVRLGTTAPLLIQPDSPLSDLADLKSEVCWAYLGQAVRCELAACADPMKRLEDLAGSSSNRPILLLELMAGNDSDGDALKVVRFLLKRLRQELLPALLTSPRIADRFKVEAMTHYVSQHRRFPDNCPSLWEPPAASHPEGRPGESLLEMVVSGAGPLALEQACSDLSSKHDFGIPPALVVALIRVAGSDPAKMRLVDLALDQLGDEQLCELLDRYGGQFPAGFPWRDTQLTRRLDAIFFRLPFEPAAFDRRVTLLEKWVDCLSQPASAESMLKVWRKLRETLETLRPEHSQGLAGLVGRMFAANRLDYSQVGKQLADYLWVVMDRERYPGESEDGELKRACLRDLGKALFGRTDFLPDGVWLAFSPYYLGKSNGRERWAPRQIAQTPLAIRLLTVLCSLLAIVVVGVWIARPRQPADDSLASQTSEKSDSAPNPPVKKAAAAADKSNKDLAPPLDRQDAAEAQLDDGGKRFLLMMLHKPLRRPMALLKNGDVEIDMHDPLREADVPHSRAASCELFLGKGRVHLKDKSYAFGNGAETSQHQSVPELAAAYQLAVVEVVLERGEEQVFTLRLQARPSPEDERSRNHRAELKKKCDKLRRKIDEQCAQLSGMLADLQGKAPVKRLAAFEELNKQFNHHPPPLPERPVSKDDPRYFKKYDDYRIALKSHLDKYSQPLIKEVGERIESLKAESRELKLKSLLPKEKVVCLLTEAVGVSAVLYWVVDGVRVDAAIIGEP